MEPAGAIGLGALALAAYLLGSVPFGLVVAKAMGLGDPREIGSGNIGATNVLRTGSKTAGALTLFLDGLKGFLPVVAGGLMFGPGGAQLAGFAAFLGHLFPVWLRFEGGKGVATFFGVIFGLAWPLGLVAGAIWLAVARLTRISSAGALAASALAPILSLALGPPGGLAVLAIIAALIWMRHHANIKRILAGTEPRIGASKKDDRR